jgi:DNA polymerase-3 subunit gamma/tau
VTEPLALKYRPRSFEDIVGQPVVRTVLSKMVSDRTVPSGLLFTGVRGAGKTTTGRIVAAGLNCEKHPVGPCGHCPSCSAVFGGNSLDVIEIDAASSGLVADVRTLTEMVQYSTGGEYRVVLLDEAHSMSREGFNALLKTLEEPPERTVFVLLTTEPHRILDTIVSRCMSFDFRKITVTDIVGRLEHIVASEGIEMQPEVLPLIAGRSDGGLRDAVMTLDQCVRAGVTTVSGFKSLVGDSDFAPGIIEAILDQDLALAYERVDSVVGKVGEPSVVISALTRALKDVVVLNSSGQIDAVGEEYEARKRLAVRMPVPLAVGWMRVLWSVKTNIRMDDSPVALIYLATALLGEVGKRPTSAPQSSSAPIVRQEKRRLSLDEMRSMAQ